MFCHNYLWVVKKNSKSVRKWQAQVNSYSLPRKIIIKKVVIFYVVLELFLKLGSQKCLWLWEQGGLKYFINNRQAYKFQYCWVGWWRKSGIYECPPLIINQLNGCEIYNEKKLCLKCYWHFIFVKLGNTVFLEVRCVSSSCLIKLEYNSIVNLLVIVDYSELDP